MIGNSKEEKLFFIKYLVNIVILSGNFFVSDGYCNSRVVQFSKNFTYINEIGSNGDKKPLEVRFFKTYSCLSLLIKDKKFFSSNWYMTLQKVQGALF